MFSPFWRLIYDGAPGHKIVFPEKEVSLGPDRIVLLPDHHRCHFREDASAPTFWVHFSHARRPVQAQTIPIELAPSHTELALIEELIPLFKDDRAEQARERIFRLSLALLHVTISRPEIQWMREKPEPLMKVVRHIEEHYRDPLYNRELARMAGLCPTDFADEFRRCQGVAPAQYIAQIRVREASQLLANSSLSVDQIADTTGFPNRSYFSRVFKRVTGESPVCFRNNHSAGFAADQPRQPNS